MKIIIGGDLVPTKSNEDMFENCQIDKLIDYEIQSLLKSADYTIFNLEAPLTNSVHSIDKYGPCLKASTKTIKGMLSFPVAIFSLANNHILDYGKDGLNETIETLNNAGIKHLGAGESIEQASKPLIIIKNNIKVGIYSCTEHEFSVATNISSGANPIDLLYSLDHIKELKEQCDFVIVLYHGGKEYYRYPSPQLQKVCRRIVEKGGDLVICQHSHCIGCSEKHKQGTIIYGQGNFLFDDGEDEFLNTGLLIQLELEKKESKTDYKIKEIPVCKNKNGVRVANKEEKSEILVGYELRSEEILKAGFVKQRYDEFSEMMITNYLRPSIGNNIVLRILNKFMGYKLIERLMDKKSFLAMQNYLECEAHHELYITGVKNKIKRSIRGK